MMKKAMMFIFLVPVIAGLVSCPAASAKMVPKEILAAADEARGNVEGVIWDVEIESTENGRNQKRRMRIKAKGYNVLAEYMWPKRVKGRKILMIDRNMWFIKPGLRKPVPLSPRQKLMGQAANGDIASANYSGDYAATVLPDEIINGEDCYCFDLNAVDNKATYERIVYWISKQRMVGVKAHFFSSSGKLLKKADFKYENTVLMDGRQHPFISQMRIVDAVITDNVTTMNYTDTTLKTISASTFNINLLRM
jgi:outer membrane lipoprotein-sorting protein